MAKKFDSTERFLKRDPKFNSRLVTKFINAIMLDGKKTIAEKIFYAALDIIEERIKGTPPNEVFEQAIQNVKPVVEVRSKRVGGSTYQVPMPVNPRRQQGLAFRWILQAARGRKGRPMHMRLADELCDAYRREGTAITQRENIHRMAESNKAFAHFAW